jgi:hypothetical protein
VKCKHSVNAWCREFGGRCKHVKGQLHHCDKFIQQYCDHPGCKQDPVVKGKCQNHYDYNKRGVEPFEIDLIDFMIPVKDRWWDEFKQTEGI